MEQVVSENEGKNPQLYFLRILQMLRFHIVIVVPDFQIFVLQNVKKIM